MYIQSIYIKTFAGLQDLALTFGDGITVLWGPNEIGKSSISAFIRFMFYGFRNKEERNRYIHWDGSQASGNMEVVENGVAYRIERIAERNSPKERVAIIDLSTHTTIATDLSPAERFLGVPVQVYDNTAFVSQMDGSHVGGKDISAAIENLLFAADENVSPKKALKRLDDARIVLYYKNRKGGRLYEMEQSRLAVLDQIEDARRTRDAIAAAEGEHAAATKQFEDAKTALANAEARKQTHIEQYTEQRYRRFAALMRDARDTGRAYEDLCARYTFDGKLLEANDVAALHALQGDLQAKTEQIRTINEEIAGIDEEESREKVSFAEAESAAKREADNILGGYTKSLETRKTCLWSAMISYAASAVFLVLAILFFRSLFGLSLGAGVCAVTALLCGIVFTAKSYSAAVYVGQIHIQYHATDRETLDRNLDRVRGQAKVRGKRLERRSDLVSRAHELEEKRVALQSTADMLCARYRAATLPGAMQAAERAFTELSNARSAAERAKTAHETFRAANPDLDAQKAAETPIHTGEEPILPPTAEFEAAVARAHAALDAARGVVYEAEKKMTALRAGAKNLAELEESLVPLDRETARLSRLHAALELAYQKLEAAGDALRGSLAPGLSAAASHYMGVATDGKYTTIGVGNQLTMEYRASTPDASQHTTDFLSAGTQDLAYISLRLALIGKLYASPPPVLFDETFSRLDDNRMRYLMRVLAECAKERRQLILFASQKREASILMSEQIPHALISLAEEA